jgi:hypothetical protein
VNLFALLQKFTEKILDVYFEKNNKNCATFKESAHRKLWTRTHTIAAFLPLLSEEVVERVLEKAGKKVFAGYDRLPDEWRSI